MLKSNIQGVIIEELKILFDSKGSVLHMIKSTSSVFTNFGECYISEVNFNCIKGWKCHKKQTQNIAVPYGKIKMVLYDKRQNSITKNNVIELILGRPDNYLRITIPPGVVYSFKCISNEKALLVNYTDIEHDPEESLTFSLKDKKIPFNWFKSN